MTKAAAAAPARQHPQPSPYQRWIPPPQASPTSDQEFTTNTALWLPPPGFNSVKNSQLVHLNSDSSDDSDDSIDSPKLSDAQALHAIVGPLSISLPTKSSMSTRLLERSNIWRTPEATCDPPPRYQASPTANDGSPPSRIPVPIRNPKPTPLSQSTPAPIKSNSVANTPRPTATPSAARLNAFKSPNNTLKSPATTIRLPVVKGAHMKEKPSLPLPKNLANTPSSAAARTLLRPQTEKTRITTSGGRATPAQPLIGLDLSLSGRKARKNSLSTPRSPRSPNAKSSSGATLSNKRAGASATMGRKSRSSSISSRRTSVSSSSPLVARKSSPVPPLPTKVTATAVTTQTEPTPATRAASPAASPAAAPAPLPPTMTSDQLDALPEIIVDEETMVSEVLPLPPPTRASPPQPPASAPATTPKASPGKPPSDVKPLMVTLPSQAKNQTTVKIVKVALPDPPPLQAQPQAQPERSLQPSPKVALKSVPAADADADSVQAKIRAYNERDHIRKRTLSIVPPPQQERAKEEEEEVMEIEAREIPQARRHSVDSNIDFRSHGVPGQPLQLTYPGHPMPYAPRPMDPSPRRRSIPMQPTDEQPAGQMQVVQVQRPIHERRRMSNSTGAPSVMTKSSSGSSRFGTEYSIPEARNRHSRGSSNANGGVAPPQMASLASPEVMDVSLVGPFTPPQPFVPSVDDRSHRRRAGQRAPPPTHADPHARLISDEYDPPRGRKMTSYHNRNPSPARAPTSTAFMESPTMPNNAPLLAPRPQPLAVVIHEPPKLVKQNSSGGSSSSGSSIQVHQVPRRNRRSIPPPQPIPVPGAPDYSQSVPPPQPLPHQQMPDAQMTMTSYGSTVASLSAQQQVAPSPYQHSVPYSSQMYNHSYNHSYSASPNVPVFGSPAPGPQTAPQGPRDFANPSHFRYRPKVLTIPTPLGPQMQGNGWTPSSSTAGSVMMMSPPYQTQQLAATTTLPGSYSPAPPHPSASPYQSYWKPYTPEPPPPSQLYPQQQMQPMQPPPQQQQQQQQQQQGRQRGHQPTRSEPPMIEFPPPLPDKPSPTTQDGYYSDARRANVEMQVSTSFGRGKDLLQPPSPVPPPIQAKPPPPSQRGHAKSMSESGPGKLNASTIARMLQAQRGDPANASSTSLNNLPVPASSTSLTQQYVPEERTNTHRPDSPVKPLPPAPVHQAQRPPASPYAQVQPSPRPRVLSKGTPPLPPASAPILIRSNSPAGPGLSPSHMHPRGFASSDALPEGNNQSNNSSSTNVSAIAPTGPTGRKISFDVPHGPEQDPPAAAAAPKKRRRGRPTNPEDNMLVDPFGFPVTEDTRYDVVERVAAEKKNVQVEPQFPAYRENYTARTNALRAQEEAEVRERERQEAPKPRRGGSPLLLRRNSPSRGSPRASPEPSAHHNRDAGPRDPHLRLYQNEPMSYSQQQLPSQQPSRPALARLGRSSSADSTQNKLRKPRDRSQSPSGYLLLRKPQLPPQPPPQPQDMRGGSPSGYLHDHPYRPAPGQYLTQSPGRTDSSNVANALRGKLTKRR